MVVFKVLWSNCLSALVRLHDNLNGNIPHSLVILHDNLYGSILSSLVVGQRLDNRKYM